MPIDERYWLKQSALYDEGSNTLVVNTEQDVEAIIERNKELQWHPGYDGYTPSRDLQKVASIPLVLAHKWMSEEGIDVFNPDHWPAVARKLNDPEYSYLRTGGGKLAGKEGR